MTLRDRFDTIVIGAGPAGAQTARSLAGTGHSVLLLDATDEIGTKLCTGIVSSECFVRFGISRELIWHEARDLEAITPSGASIKISRSEPSAYVIDRAAFITSIADAAAAAGADVRLRQRVVGLGVTSDGITVQARTDAGLETYFGRTAVVASGFRTKLASKVGLDVPQTSAYSAQATVTGIDLDATQVIARGVVPRTFFAWLVPVGAGTAHLGLLGRERPLPAFHSMVNSLRRRGYSFELKESPKTWGVPLRGSRRSFADRCLLVGDAAGQVKPTTGGGIYYSLIAGNVAAEVLSDGLRRDDVSARSLSVYERRWKREIGRELQLGYLARLFYEHMADEDVERAILAAKSSGFLDEELPFDRHSRLAVRALRSELFRSLLRAGSGIAARVGIARFDPSSVESGVSTGD